MTKHLLIAGASIAGPALAHWLHRYGFTVTVIERAPELRPGGQAVDLRGISKEVVRRMGLMEQVRAACTDTRGMSYVNSRNKQLAAVRSDQLGGDGLIAEIEILRGDLAAVLYRATSDHVEYLFGDQIDALDERPDGVEVSMASGATRRFDLVVGADGLHSGTRALLFGPERQFSHDLGFFLGFYTVPNRLELDRWAVGYTEVGRGAGMRSIRDNAAAMAFLSFRAERGDFDHRDVASHRALVRTHFAGMAWEVPWLLEQMDQAEDFYLDTCSQIMLPSWSKGRVTLLGDAAFCASPISGQGTSLAFIGAYVLAGELARQEGAGDGSYRVAFAEYERRLRGLVEATQRMGQANARRVSANNRAQLWLQVQALRLLPYPPLKYLVTREMNKVINGIELPDYQDLVAGGMPSGE
ncbi:MAG TPA: FAD-dependent monooxygenase [Pseudonocardia sp.]|jgi:2-polyprenyl-6-methoxyphenol hydroxylase-like FAD-dependent oxidoreductase